MEDSGEHLQHAHHSIARALELTVPDDPAAHVAELEKMFPSFDLPEELQGGTAVYIGSAGILSKPDEPDWHTLLTEKYGSSLIVHPGETAVLMPDGILAFIADPDVAWYALRTSPATTVEDTRPVLTIPNPIRPNIYLTEQVTRRSAARALLAVVTRLFDQGQREA